jgi:hypothetical protein
MLTKGQYSNAFTKGSVIRMHYCQETACWFEVSAWASMQCEHNYEKPLYQGTQKTSVNYFVEMFHPRNKWYRASELSKICIMQNVHKNMVLLNIFISAKCAKTYKFSLVLDTFWIYLRQNQKLHPRIVSECNPHSIPSSTCCDPRPLFKIKLKFPKRSPARKT